MKQIDRQYLATPFYGARKIAAWLKSQGQPVNRKRVRRLMRRWGSGPSTGGPGPASRRRAIRSTHTCSAAWQSHVRTMSGRRIEEIINDPNRLSEIIKDSIESLMEKEADLSARIRPIEERLAEIAEQKARLADDWVIHHMHNDKFKELKDNLDREDSRIKALKAEIDPAQIAELESTRGVLRFWENQIKSMAWNTENEDGSMVRLVDQPHKVALKVVGFEDKELSQTLGFPASKRELFDKLQVKLIVFSDRIEINGLFPIQPIDIQSLVSTRGDRRGILSTPLPNLRSPGYQNDFCLRISRL
jgi:hypothetical protein